jgi:hypothetical protein
MFAFPTIVLYKTDLDNFVVPLTGTITSIFIVILCYVVLHY